MKSSRVHADASGPTESPIRSTHRWIFRNWIWEVICLTIALILVAAIVGVLISFNGQPVPEWEYSITLNTLIALLSTVLRALIVIVLAEVISQQKWVWFKDEARSLYDLQQFDEASRGIWGSMGLISLLKFGLRGSRLAALASLATILSVAIGPFAQQAVKTVVCQGHYSGPDASLSMARLLPGADGFGLMGDHVHFKDKVILENGTVEEFEPTLDPGGRLKAAMCGSLLDSEANHIIPRFTCPTGNCTFEATAGESNGDVKEEDREEPTSRDTHSSLGICSSCVDSSSLVELSETQTRGWNASLGSVSIQLHALGKWLDVGPTDPKLTKPLFAEKFDSPPTEEVSVLTTLVWSDSNSVCGPGGCTPDRIAPGEFVFRTTSEFSWVATSCAFYTCVKDMASRVNGGELIEEVVDTRIPALVSGPYDDFRMAVDRKCDTFGGRFENATRFTDIIIRDNDKSNVVFVFRDDNAEVAVSAGCLYVMKGEYDQAIQTYLNQTFLSGECRLSYNFKTFSCKEKWWLLGLMSNMTASYSSLETTFETLATAMTTFFRNDGWGSRNDVSRYSFRGRLLEHSLELGNPVEGQVVQMTVCVQLDWPWLLYPSILCVLTIGLLTGTIICNHRDGDQPAWKASLMPLLFYGLQPSPTNRSRGESGSNNRALSALDRRAKETIVQLSYGSVTGADMMPRAGFMIQNALEMRDVGSWKHEQGSEAASLLTTGLTDGASDARSGETHEYPWSIPRKPLGSVSRARSQDDR